MKVLIVKLSALGDVVQSLPVAMAIRTQVPDAQIDWVVERPASGLLLGHQALDRVLVSPRHMLKDELAGFVPGLMRFVRELRKVSYDAVLDLQGLMKSAMVVSLSRGKRKIGFKGGKEPASAMVLNEALPPYDIERHALERYLDLLEPLGLQRPAFPDFGLHPGEKPQARAAELLAKLPKGAKFIVLHPMAKWETKLWPSKHWILLGTILQRLGYHVVLTGSTADRGVTGVIHHKLAKEPLALNLAGHTDLPELSAVLTKALAVVSTDTGVMHLAAALGLPVAAIFGPTAPWRTGPYGRGHLIMRRELECSPCFKKECDDLKCMTELIPVMAARMLKPWLDGLNLHKQEQNT